MRIHAQRPSRASMQGEPHMETDTPFGLGAKYSEQHGRRRMTHTCTRTMSSARQNTQQRIHTCRARPSGARAHTGHHVSGSDEYAFVRRIYELSHERDEGQQGQQHRQGCTKLYNKARITTTLAYTQRALIPRAHARTCGVMRFLGEGAWTLARRAPTQSQPNEHCARTTITENAPRPGTRRPARHPRRRGQRMS
jgi:hypothetical protein